MKGENKLSIARNHVWVAAGFLLLPLLFCGCGQESYDDLTRDYLGTMDKLVTQLEQIEDAETAEKRKVILGPLLAELKRLQEKQESMGDMDESQQQSIETRYQEEFEKLTTRYTKALEPITANKEIRGVLESELKTLANLLDARSPV